MCIGLLARKAVAGMLAFIIGVSIVIALIVPLVLFLSSSSGEVIRALNVLGEFQSQKAQEDLDVVLDRGRFFIKNAGSLPTTIVLVLVDRGLGCARDLSLYKVSLTIDPGASVAVIPAANTSLGPDAICYVVTSRGNVFSIRERFLRVSGVEVITVITNQTTRFADDMASWNIDARFSRGSDMCDVRGIPWVGVPARSVYGKMLLTVNESSTATVIYDLNATRQSVGCASFTFNNLVRLDRPSYAVIVLLRIVIISLENTRDAISATADITLRSGGLAIGSTSTAVVYSPQKDLDLFVWDLAPLIPARDAPPGDYSLEVRVVLNQISGRGKYIVGIEYLALQGARLVV